MNQFIRASFAALTLALGCGSSPTATTQSLVPSNPGGPTVPTQPNTPVVTGFQQGFLNGAGITNPYQAFVPLNYDASKKWPLIVYLHGSGERGSDNQAQVNAGLGPVVKANQSTWAAITIFPQVGLTEGERTGYLRVALSSIDSMAAKYNIDPTRIYLMGLSVGGMYGFEVIYRNPGKFAAIVAMSSHQCVGCITGNNNASQAQATLPVVQANPTIGYWQFHGDQDTTFPVADARADAATWQSVNPLGRYTEYKGVGHSSWDNALADPTLIPWLLSQHR